MAEIKVDDRFAKPTTLFFGIGAQKAGTSWLHAYLDQHPDVSVPQGKEMHYWSYLETGYSFHHNRQKDRLEKFSNAKGVLGKLGKANAKLPPFFADYVEMRETKDPSHSLYANNLFDGYTDQKVVGEITPDYSKLSSETFAQMAALNSDTKFIFVMRDPIERLHSAMRMRLRGQGNTSRKLGQDEILDALKEVVSTPNAAPLRRSRYDQTLANLEAAVAAENIGYFFYEDIFEKRNVDDVCDFLGIDRRPGDFDAQVNAGAPKEKEFDPAFRALALAHVGEVYDLMQARFGDRLPAAWKMHFEGESGPAKVAENVE